MVLSDYHIHSSHSFDADAAATPDAICRAAIDKGLRHIAITDHFDVNGMVERIYPPLFLDRSYPEIVEARDRYQKKLSLAVGIELGQLTQYPDEALRVLEAYPFDYVLASVHNLKNKADFYYFDFSLPDDALLHTLWDETLDDLLAVCDFPVVNTVAHITYPFRYLAKAGRSLSQEPHREKLISLYRKMIERGIALEVNTSSLSTELGAPMPSYDLISLYREVGGELITLGSDAHTPKKIAQHMKEAQEALLDIGFRYLTIWQDRKPVPLKLI